MKTHSNRIEKQITLPPHYKPLQHITKHYNKLQTTTNDYKRRAGVESTVFESTVCGALDFLRLIIIPVQGCEEPREVAQGHDPREAMSPTAAARSGHDTSSALTEGSL